MPVNIKLSTKADKVEIDFLYFSCGLWDFPKEKDTEIVDVNYVFLGPCMPSDISKHGYLFKEDARALKLFHGGMAQLASMSSYRTRGP